MISVKRCSDEPVHIGSETQIDEISKVDEPFSDWLFFCNKICALVKLALFMVYEILQLATAKVVISNCLSYIFLYQKQARTIQIKVQRPLVFTLFLSVKFNFVAHLFTNEFSSLKSSLHLDTSPGLSGI